MTEWVTDIVDRLGYVGVAFLVALESLFPPIPSELILPLAGFVAGQGDANFLGMVLAATDRLAGRVRGSSTASRRRSVRSGCIVSSSGTAAGSGSRTPTWSEPRTGSTGVRPMPCCSAGACR